MKLSQNNNKSLLDGEQRYRSKTDIPHPITEL